MELRSCDNLRLKQGQRLCLQWVPVCFIICLVSIMIIKIKVQLGESFWSFKSSLLVLFNMWYINSPNCIYICFWSTELISFFICRSKRIGGQSNWKVALALRRNPNLHFTCAEEPCYMVHWVCHCLCLIRRNWAKVVKPKVEQRCGEFGLAWIARVG